MNTKDSAQSKYSGVFWGVVLILLGVLFLLERLGYLDVGEVFSTYWPVILILVGIKLILNPLLKNTQQDENNDQVDYSVEENTGE